MALRFSREGKPMNSYILHFRAWIIAILAMVAIEVAIYALRKPSVFERTNFLQFSFVKPETPQRLFTFHKLSEFAHSNPTIVQAGDSSGFYGIEPAVVMKHLPAGVSYLNMSCCANLGFSGYYNILQFMAEQNNSVRYLVLHITPYTMPRPQLWKDDGAALWQDANLKVFGGDVYHEYLSTWRYLHLPSLVYRRPVTDRFYYLNGLFNDLNRPLLDNVNYASFLKVYKTTRGWMPETDVRVHVPPAECTIDESEFFDISRMGWKTYTEEVFDAYAALAHRFNATLVIVFQPVACTFGTGAGSAKVRTAIEQFQANHPEVEIPFPFIETWPSDLFSVPAHVKSEYTDLIGNRLGKAMAEIVRRRDSNNALHR
jgi:hypothetical protein